MEITFHGAAGEVTGSCYLITGHDKRVLIDCGQFQGTENSDDANAAAFPFDPASIDYVVLTHAHLDHCGRLPLLVKRGFRGEIVATSATRDLARLVLLDAARLQTEDAKRHTRAHLRRGEGPATPLYDELDVLDMLDRVGRALSYATPFDLCDGVRVTFGDAGHILGSAWVLVEVADREKTTRLLFSGDLGNRHKPLLNPPAPAPAAEYVTMESTYGDRLHKSLDASVQEFKEAILDTLARGGNVIIPTFALERAQELLYYLSRLVEKHELPQHLGVYLDSPMAISATEIFRRHPDCLNAETRDALARGEDPFTLPGLRLTRDSADSMAINQIRGGAVILAGSGMATGGRVLHHLRHNLWRSDSSVVFVGYAATGTLARRIIDGARKVHIFGEEIRVAAKIYTIGGFSAHADRDELVDWHRSTGTPTETFLVHGEENARQALASTLRANGFAVTLPALHATYTI